MHLKSSRADIVLAVFKTFIIPLSQPEALTLTPVSTFLHKFPCMNLNLFCLLKLISCQTLIINKICSLKPVPWELCLSKPIFWQSEYYYLTSHWHKTTVPATRRNQVHTYSMSQRTADTGVEISPIS